MEITRAQGIRIGQIAALVNTEHVSAEAVGNFIAVSADTAFVGEFADDLVVMIDGDGNCSVLSGELDIPVDLEG